MCHRKYTLLYSCTHWHYNHSHAHTIIKPHPHTGRIIVGAPRGTFPGGLDLDAASTPENQTGLVYDCPVSRGSCGRLGDGTGLSEKLFDPTRKEGGKGEGMGRKEGERREREVGKREREGGSEYHLCILTSFLLPR